ncbi:hypothetical protein CHI10_03215 [Bacillus sp. 7894-2]|nr:hypothetical protein CHI10_03215 [Bacillus sp. 7894-2]
MNDNSVIVYFFIPFFIPSPPDDQRLVFLFSLDARNLIRDWGLKKKEEKKENFETFLSFNRYEKMKIILIFI